jgi:N6-L-threonylcarbamoyladenine synthase
MLCLSPRIPASFKHENPTMLTLGIETSCDETAVALYDLEKGILGQRLHSQIELHRLYGGVVPELASRDHVRYLKPLLDDLLAAAHVKLTDLKGIAYTSGPGLVGALLVGAMFGRSLAYALKIPAIGIHHMEGHLLAALLDQPALSFPFVALLVSGGHTFLVKVVALGQYEILGESIDDAVGEAFDKTASLLGLSYPGGPAIERLAAQGDPKRFHLPRPMVDRPNCDFSFSGLKTAVLELVRKHEPLDVQTRADIAAAFQVAAVETLIKKTERALRSQGLKTLVVAGGVSANTSLRSGLNGLIETLGGTVYYPPLDLCTDNAVMIAYAGALRLARGESDDLRVMVKPRWSLESL